MGTNKAREREVESEISIFFNRIQKNRPISTNTKKKVKIKIEWPID